MLRIRVSELSLPDRNRLNTELTMTLLGDFTYPPFMDYRGGTLRMRPYSQAALHRAEDFVAGLRLDGQATMEIASSALAEQLADMLVNYHRAVLPDRAQRHGNELHRQAMQAATQVQRRLVDYVLNGANNGFGLAVAPTSWSAGQSQAAPWEAIAPGTVSLATALATLREETSPAPAAPSFHRNPPPRPSAPIPPSPEDPALPEMRTTLLPAIPRTPSAPITPPASPKPSAPIAPPATPRPSAPMAPPPPAPEALLTAPLPRSVELPKTPTDQRNDVAAFTQLREQLLSAMTNAARNYGITHPAADPAGLLASLRLRNAIDESDLRLAEGILAACGRVITAGRASIDDYREALMLYLLFHRSHFAKR
jgi:hypothetical protein